MSKEDLALNNPQCLICHKTKPTNQSTCYGQGSWSCQFVSTLYYEFIMVMVKKESLLKYYGNNKDLYAVVNSKIQVGSPHGIMANALDSHVGVSKF